MVGALEHGFVRLRPPACFASETCDCCIVGPCVPCKVQVMSTLYVAAFVDEGV